MLRQHIRRSPACTEDKKEYMWHKEKGQREVFHSISDSYPHIKTKRGHPTPFIVYISQEEVVFYLTFKDTRDRGTGEEG